VPRLRRSSPAQPGWRRLRSGRGFRYLDTDGRPLAAADRERCVALVIPPAWRDVWICPWPNGHLQAVGTDAAGRRQYLYHEAWRVRRDRAKYDRMLELAVALPSARPVVADHLQARGMPARRALAVAFRILDRGFLRVGGEQYAAEYGSFGLATLRVDHTTVRGDRLRLRFPGKAGVEHDVVLWDPQLAAAVRSMRRGRPGAAELLAWQDRVAGNGSRERPWRDITSADINTYVRDVTGADVTAKDFRTWHGTVLAATSMAVAEDRQRLTSKTARKRALGAVFKEVAEHLGNTPAVARASYVDPRLVDRFLAGSTISLPAATASSDGLVDQVEAAVIELLT